MSLKCSCFCRWRITVAAPNAVAICSVCLSVSGRAVNSSCCRWCVFCSTRIQHSALCTIYRTGTLQVRHSCSVRIIRIVLRVWEKFPNFNEYYNGYERSEQLWSVVFIFVATFQLIIFLTWLNFGLKLDSDRNSLSFSFSAPKMTGFDSFGQFRFRP